MSECRAHPNRGLVHPGAECECFRGGPAPEHAQVCPHPGCTRQWLVDSIRQQCVDEGHVGGVGA